MIAVPTKWRCYWYSNDNKIVVSTSRHEENFLTMPSFYYAAAYSDGLNDFRCVVGMHLLILEVLLQVSNRELLKHKMDGSVVGFILKVGMLRDFNLMAVNRTDSLLAWKRSRNTISVFRVYHYAFDILYRTVTIFGARFFCLLTRAVSIIRFSPRWSVEDMSIWESLWISSTSFKKGRLRYQHM